MESHTILTRNIRSRGDMLDVEEAITKQLGGEYNRCSFLRSVSYVRLRIAALYPKRSTNNTCHTAFCGNLSVTLVPPGPGSEDGPVVTLMWLDKITYFEDEKAKRKRRASHNEQDFTAV